MSNLLLKVLSPRPKLENFGRYLFIGPHPDDIEVGAGATAAKLADMGKEVYFLICTDGCYGSENCDISKEDVTKIRKTEAQNAANYLKVKELRMLDFSDGGMYPYEEMVKEIAKEIADINPDIIFAPDPDLKSECHLDHIKVAKAVNNAYLLAGNPLIMKDLGVDKTAVPKALAYYYTNKPNTYISVRKTYKKQLEALALHKSQAEIKSGNKTFLEYMKIYFAYRNIRFGIRSFKGRADGFRVITNITMHCFAEKL